MRRSAFREIYLILLTEQGLKMQTSADRKGFTLIEMLVVVSIIGLLLSISGRHNTQALGRARDSAIKMELQQLRNAVYQFAIDNHGRFPETLDQLVPDHLRSLPAGWKGANADGVYNYDQISGLVSLGASSAKESALDISGVAYDSY